MGLALIASIVLRINVLTVFDTRVYERGKGEWNENAHRIRAFDVIR